jgi:hypothetical protein
LSKKKNKKEKFSRWMYYCEQPKGLFFTFPNPKNSTMKQGRWIFMGAKKIGAKTFWIYEKIKKNKNNFQKP